MKILVKHFLCKIFLSVFLLYNINLYADESFADYDFSQDMNWANDPGINQDIFEPINRSFFYFNDSFLFFYFVDVNFLDSQISRQPDPSPIAPRNRMRRKEP